MKYDTHYKCYTCTTISIIEQHGPTFEAEDMVADIGSGTGEIAHQLWKSKDLKNPIVCVEPMSSMLEHLKMKDGVEAVQASAEEFVTLNKFGKRFDKILLCGSAHHLSDPTMVFTALFEQLTEKGVCIIVYPMNYSLLSTFANSLVSKANTKFRENLMAIFKKMDVRWSETSHAYSCTVPKRECYAALRDRFLTFLEQLTNDEIEERIEELEKEICQQDAIEWSMKMYMCVVEKKK